MCWLVALSTVHAAKSDAAQLTAGTRLPDPQYIHQAIRVLGKASEINEDEHQVLRWFLQERLSLFAMATPAEVVASSRTDPLLKYLDSISAGSSG